MLLNSGRVVTGWRPPLLSVRSPSLSTPTGLEVRSKRYTPPNKFAPYRYVLVGCALKLSDQPESFPRPDGVVVSPLPVDTLLSTAPVSASRTNTKPPPLPGETLL